MSPAERVCMMAGHLDAALAEHRAATAALEAVLSARPVDFTALHEAARRAYMATGSVVGFSANVAWDVAPS